MPVLWSPVRKNNRKLSVSTETDKRIDSLLGEHKLEEAYTLAEQNQPDLQRYTIGYLGKKYIDHLLDNLKFSEVANVCSKIPIDKQAWVELVSEFLKLKKIKILAPCIPINDIKGQLQLETKIYDAILCELLNDSSDIEAKTIVLQLVTELWPKHLYDVDLLVETVLNELVNDSDNRIMLSILAKLFCHQEKFDKALSLYLKLQDKYVFHLVKTHLLFGQVIDKIETLMDVDCELSIELFIRQIDRFKPENVVNHLMKHFKWEKYLFSYLDALFNKTHTRCLTQQCLEYQNHLVYLYRSYAPQKLLSFLKSSDHYNLQEALLICKGKEFANERIFILARIGNTNQALKIIVTELRDIKYALKFCKEYDTPDMWNSLISLSMKEAPFVKGLIDNIGIDQQFVDLKEIIESINPVFEIPNLKESLVAILKQYRAQINIFESSKRIMMPDKFSLIVEQDKFSSKGIQMDYESKCGVCRLSILKPLLATGGPGKNYLPASVNNKCATEDCACHCPDQTTLYGGPKGCKTKHSNHWKEELGASLEGEALEDKANTTIVFMCRHAYHFECLDKDPSCKICEVGKLTK